MAAKVLVIDLGGTNLKVLVSSESQPRECPSGPLMTPATMVDAVKALTAGWTYDLVSIGFPGAVARNLPTKEPVNLGSGWVRFDYALALGRPIKMVNDAAMQALGGYTGGRMLFLGLGAGLASAMVVDSVIVPMELGQLARKNDQTYGEVVGMRGIQRLGKKTWRREVAQVVEDLAAALQPDYVVLGGANAPLLKALPAIARLGNERDAFDGGFRLWPTDGRHREPRQHLIDLPRLVSAQLDSVSPWPGY